MLMSATPVFAFWCICACASVAAMHEENGVLCEAHNSSTCGEEGPSKKPSVAVGSEMGSALLQAEKMVGARTYRTQKVIADALSGQSCSDEKWTCATCRKSRTCEDWTAENGNCQKYPDQENKDGEKAIDTCCACKELYPIVTLPEGARIRGKREPVDSEFGDFSFSVDTFYDLRYATADRFESPELYHYTEGTFDKNVHEKITCLQVAGTWEEGQEQCLFLDVYRPVLKGDSLPVMVYIHGGGLVVGSKQNYNFVDGLKAIVSEGVIVVAINYRLAILGLWTNPRNSSQGLWALRDQIMALEWVKYNIHSFGGDPESVTIFGQSGGGLSVLALYSSPMAKGLFHKAIAQSPGWQTPAQYQKSADDAKNDLALACQKALDCDGGENPDQGRLCMKERNVGDPNILQDGLLGRGACRYFWYPPRFLTGSEGVLAGYDGKYLTQGLYDATCNDEDIPGSDVPLLVGSNLHEWTFFDRANDGFELLTNTADQKDNPYDRTVFLDYFLRDKLHGYATASDDLKHDVTKCLKSFYANKFSPDDQDPALNMDPLSQLLTDVMFTIGPQLLSVVKGAVKYRYVIETTGTGEYPYPDSAHGDELCFLHERSMKHWTTKKGCDGKAEKGTGKMLREYWTSFAKTGKPSSPWADDLGVPEWLPVDRTDGLMIGVPLMRLNLSTDGSSSDMSSSPWSTKESATLLAKIACGRVHVENVCGAVE